MAAIPSKQSDTVVPQATRVLFVDDDRLLRQAVPDLLSAYGYQVTEAASASEALDHLKTLPFDIMLSDVNMPEMDGIQLLSIASRVYPDMPVVMLTGYGDVEMAREALHQGASDFLVKPISSARELPIIVERNLERRRLERQRLIENKQAILMETIGALVATIDAKQPYTAKHSLRVNRLALALGDAIPLPPDERYVLELASQMHDIGKIAMPDHILDKPGSLNEEEWACMKSHPDRGVRIIGNISALTYVASIIRHHHERMDGQGYPDGLKGQAIPLLSRIIYIADAYEAMTSDRSYRKRLPSEEAARRLRESAGTQFDPELVPLFLQVLEQNPSLK
ncbi:MAG: response regulator [Armatimonadetes bacterium]|nr:response regulator [Armatimonadota bacterium]